jgi:hypothetical protein
MQRQWDDEEVRDEDDGMDGIYGESQHDEVDEMVVVDNPMLAHNDAHVDDFLADNFNAIQFSKPNSSPATSALPRVCLHKLLHGECPRGRECVYSHDPEELRKANTFYRDRLDNSNYSQSPPRKPADILNRHSAFVASSNSSSSSYNNNHHSSYNNTPSHNSNNNYNSSTNPITDTHNNNNNNRNSSIRFTPSSHTQTRQHQHNNDNNHSSRAISTRPVSFVPKSDGALGGKPPA